MTFFIQVGKDSIRNQIMEYIIKKSLTHSSSNLYPSMGINEIEIIGSVEDYQYFNKLIEDTNLQRGKQVAQINESI